MKKIIYMMAMLMVITTVIPVFSNPFKDVKKDHWAYKSIQKLCENNIIDGYENGKFHGNKTVTRYEAAQMVAKLAEKVQNPQINKLMIEFADELAILGVKIHFLEKDVKKIKIDQEDIKKRIENNETGKIKFNVESRLRFEENSYDTNNTVPLKVMNYNANYIRTRLNLSAIVDDNISAYFSFQDDTRFTNGNQNNSNGAANNLNAGVTRNIFIGYVDIKNMGNIIDRSRFGRQTVTIGKGLILDDEIDGLLINKKYRGINFDFGAFEIDNQIAATTILGAGINDGLNFKILSASKTYDKFTASAYYGRIDQSERTGTNLIIGEGNVNLYGIALDGNLCKDVAAYVEYSNRKMDNFNENSNGDPLGAGIATEQKGAAIKLGVGWDINSKYDLNFIYQKREKDFRVIGHNDDYSDSIFYGNISYTNGGITPSVIAGATNITDSYNNSKIMSVIFGSKIRDNIQLDLWYEDLKGDRELGAAGTGITNNYDQTGVQAVVSYQYRENTNFKLRYRSVKFDENDADFKTGTAAGTNPADYQQVRLDVNVKF